MGRGNDADQPLPPKGNQYPASRRRSHTFGQTVGEHRIERHGNCNVAELGHRYENAGRSCILAPQKNLPRRVAAETLRCP